MYFLEDLDEEEYEIAIKVVIVGNGAVGKSSMIQRYCKGIFTRNYKKTIGVDFLEKHITASGEDVRLMLWDTAGQEEFDAITKAYYRGAQACVIAFSTTDHASFEAVKKWKRKVEDECGHVPMVLVQNKIDLLHESQVDSHEVEKFARNTGLKLFRTSVKENLNIGRVFQHLAERHIESVSRWSDESPESTDYNHHNPILQIGHHPSHNHRDVRVRFANEHELNDVNQSHNNQNNNKGIALYPRGFKPATYYKNNYHRKITNPFTKWTSNTKGGSRPQNSDYYSHHPRYFHVHLHQQPPTPPQPSFKQACRMI